MPNFFATLWTVACQASLSMGFPRQIYWSGLPFPSPGDLPNSGTEPTSPALEILLLFFFFNPKLYWDGLPFILIQGAFSPAKIWNASRICMSSLCRGHANLLCIVPILVYVLPKRALHWRFFIA